MNGVVEAVLNLVGRDDAASGMHASNKKGAEDRVDLHAVIGGLARPNVKVNAWTLQWWRCLRWMDRCRCRCSEGGA